MTVWKLEKFMNNLIRDKFISSLKLVIDNDELKLVKLCRNNIDIDD